MVPVTKGKQHKMNNDTISMTPPWTAPDKKKRFVHWQEYRGEKARHTTLYTDGTVFEKVLDAMAMAGMTGAEIESMTQILGKVVTHYSATVAAGAWKGQKNDATGIKKRAGYDWDCDNHCLTIRLRPWKKRTTGDEKQDSLNASIIKAVDAQVESGVVTLEGRETILRMMGYKGDIPPYGEEDEEELDDEM